MTYSSFNYITLNEYNYVNSYKLYNTVSDYVPVIDCEVPQQNGWSVFK